MKKLSFALVAFSIAMPALAAQDVAPAVKRKPAATAPAPKAAPAAAPTAAPTAAPAPAPAAQQIARPGSQRDYQTVLTALTTQAGSDAALDTSLIRVMSRLIAAGQCGEATSLATRGGRKELASKAQQLCR